MFTLHELVTDGSLIPDIEEQCRAGSRGCVDCKRILADSLVREFAPFRERAEYLRAHPAEVRDVLEAGADRARGPWLGRRWLKLAAVWEIRWRSAL